MNVKKYLLTELEISELCAIKECIADAMQGIPFADVSTPVNEYGAFLAAHEYTERTCKVTDFVNFDGGHEPGNPVIGDGYHILSCGHKCPGNWYEEPNYCPVCGAKVVEP